MPSQVSRNRKQQHPDIGLVDLCGMLPLIIDLDLTYFSVSFNQALKLLKNFGFQSKERLGLTFLTNIKDIIFLRGTSYVLSQSDPLALLTWVCHKTLDLAR